MTFLFDDDVPDDLSHLLKHIGHRVTFLREVLPRDTPDAAVLDHAVQGDKALGLHGAQRLNQGPEAAYTNFGISALRSGIRHGWKRERSERCKPWPAWLR